MLIYIVHEYSCSILFHIFSSPDLWRAGANVGRGRKHDDAASSRAELWDMP